ncbi:MAG: AI-2E family transporter [Methanomicrobiales archaeon]|nr:AI-2E family transporter [Methanomicrobiales archaeon]
MEIPGRKKILVLALLFAAVVLLALFWHLLDMIPFGVAAAVVAAPLKNRLDRYLPGWLSATAITLAILVLLAAGVLVTIQAMQENLATNEEILGKIAGGLEAFTPQLTVMGVPEEAIHSAIAWIEGSIESVAGFWYSLSLASVLFTPRVSLLLLSLALALWKGDEVIRWALPRIPQAWMAIYPNLAAVSVDTLYAVIVVHLLIVAITLGISLPFFWILGYGHVLYLSLVTAFCELVPVLGASIPMVILLLYAMALGDLRGFLLVLLVGYLGVALLPEVTLRPILMGRRTLLSPVLMFVSFLGGIVILGISGFLLGPLVVAIAVSWYRLRKEGRLQGKEAPD